MFGLALPSRSIVRTKSVLLFSSSDRSFMKYCRHLFERRRNAMLLWPTRKYGNSIGSESMTAEAMYGVSATTTTVKPRGDASSAGGGDRCRIYKVTTFSGLAQSVKPYCA